VPESGRLTHLALEEGACFHLMEKQKLAFDCLERKREKGKVSLSPVLGNSSTRARKWGKIVLDKRTKRVACVPPATLEKKWKRGIIPL